MDGGASAMLLRVMCPLKKIGYVLGNFFQRERREGVGSMEGM